MAQMQGNRAGSRRHIGPIGTTARVVLGVFLVGYGLLGGTLVVSHGHWRTGFEAPGVVLGLIGFPALLLVWQWMRARRDATRFEATGPVGTAINMAVFLALFLTPWYAPAFSFTSDAAVVFYGASMLLAAVRGYGGCEVLAVSNWVLGRDDQVGCFVFGPVDYAERRLGQRQLHD
jgi:hypothetical protein